MKYLICLSIALLCVMATPQLLSQEATAKNPLVDPAKAHYLIIGMGGEGQTDMVGIESAKNFYALLGADTGNIIPKDNITLLTNTEAKTEELESLIKGSVANAGSESPLIILIFAPMLGDQHGRPHIMTADYDPKKINESTLSIDEIALLSNPNPKVPVTQLMYYDQALEHPIRIKRTSTRDSRRRQADANKAIKPQPMLMMISRPGYSKDQPVSSDPTATPAFKLSDVVRVNAKHPIVSQIIIQFKHLKMYRELINTQGQRFRYIEAGAFMMGSTGAKQRRPENEAPRHHVRITRPFYVATHETSIADYTTFTNESDYVTQAESRESEDTWKENSAYKNKSDRYPASYLSLRDSLAYAEWLTEKENLSYRLPTEAEWEYFARAGQPSNIGHVVGPVQGLDPNWANYSHFHRTAKPVGSFMPNPWGLYDTMGNVIEWTTDTYQDYTRDIQVDPDFSNGAGEHVLRGGSWQSPTKYTHLAARVTLDNINTGALTPATGFRLILEIPE